MSSSLSECETKLFTICNKCFLLKIELKGDHSIKYVVQEKNAQLSAKH